jgi:hypothetical protein
VNTSLAPEHAAARIGNMTASRFADVIARTKSGYSASRKNYCAELVVERLTGQAAPRYVSKEMQRGIDLEAQARAAYSFLAGGTLFVPGYVAHPSINCAGASPDGYLRGPHANGQIEVKCPNTAQHIALLTSARTVEDIDPAYCSQMLWQLCCSGREWCDYVSYDDRLPPKLSIVIIRYEPSLALRQWAEGEAAKFVAEVDEMEAKLRGMM